MKRIYPLYWVSLIISFLAILVIIPALHVSLLPTLQASLLGQNGLSQSDVMICLLGAQVLLYPRFINMPNRWFIGTILICYLLYPPIAYFSKNDVRRVILVSAILFLCWSRLTSFSTWLATFISTSTFVFYGRNYCKQSKSVLQRRYYESPCGILCIDSDFSDLCTGSFELPA